MIQIFAGKNMEVFEMLTAVEPSERCRLFFRIDMGSCEVRIYVRYG
jgi:hypothetical protein